MTGFMHEKEFSRKTFVKGGGALIVGFSVLGSALAGKASAAGGDPFASNGLAAVGQQGRRFRRRQDRPLRRASRRQGVQGLDAGKLGYEPDGRRQRRVRGSNAGETG